MVHLSSQHRHGSTPTVAASVQQLPFQAVVYGSIDVPAGMSPDEAKAYVRENALAEGFWNKTAILVGNEPDEIVANLTDDIVQYVRKAEAIVADTDEDHTVYERWHNLVRSCVRP